MSLFRQLYASYSHRYFIGFNKLKHCSSSTAVWDASKNQSHLDVCAMLTSHSSVLYTKLDPQEIYGLSAKFSKTSESTWNIQWPKLISATLWSKLESVGDARDGLSATSSSSQHFSSFYKNTIEDQLGTVYTHEWISCLGHERRRFVLHKGNEACRTIKHFLRVMISLFLIFLIPIIDYHYCNTFFIFKSA